MLSYGDSKGRVTKETPYQTWDASDRPVLLEASTPDRSGSKLSTSCSRNLCATPKPLHLYVGFIDILLCLSAKFHSACFSPFLSDSPCPCVSQSLVNASEGLIPIRSHPAYLLLVHVLLQAFVQVLPPFKQQRMADEFEPRGKLEGSIVEHQLQSIGSHVSSIADFVQIRLKINVGFDEENIID